MTKFDVEKLFAENVEKERYRLNLTQKQMADALEMSLSAYKRMINQSTEKIDLYIVYRLYQLTGRTAYDLMGIDTPSLEILKKLQSLSRGQISFVDSVIELEKSLSEPVPKQNDAASFPTQSRDPADFITVFIPTGNMEDGMIYDSANIQKEIVPACKTRYGVSISCGIRVTSNHLHPVYNLGDTLLISCRPIRDGDTGIFINRECGRAYIRKFHQTDPCTLLPINGYGEPIYVDSHSKADMDRWIKFGVVIAKLR